MPSSSRASRLTAIGFAIVGAVLAATHSATITSAAPPQAEQEVSVQLAPATPTGRVQVLIELAQDPAATVYARVIEQAPAVSAAVRQSAAQAGLQQVQRVVGEQQQVAAAIAARGIQTTEIFRVQKSMNAIAAEVDGADVPALRRVAGIKAVHFLELEYPTSASAVPFIGAPPVWGNTLGLPAGATGAGIRVGVIDTGVDYLHPDFGGSGLLADYQANDRTVTDSFYPSAKVAGGFDFAGDNYNGSAATILPDPDPMDCNGHGSHVAGSAAGFGVNGDGTRYADPYGPAVPFSSLRIGPGSAPQALLYALRVFGCGGGTNLTVLAIDWAMDPNDDNDLSDHLDVINMSLGSALGSLTSTTTIAAENAAAAGVIVVASAGNNGDTTLVNGSPGVSGRTISVAASLDSGVGALVLRVNTPAGIAGYKTTGIAVSFGGQAPAGGLTADVVQAVDPADGAGPLTTDGCSALTNAAAIAGNIAFIDRGTCGFSVKVKNAQDAGAVGVVIANNVAGAVGNMAGTDPTVTIPVFLVSQTDGNAIRANLGAPVNVTLFNGGDTLASFSSRGPGPSLRAKPDIAAPGYNIQSAQTGTTCTGVAPSTGCQTVNATGVIADGQMLSLNGTSMAAPHVAGVMALLRQLHPDWSVEQLKALVMNTATHDVTTQPAGLGSRYGSSRVGAGRIDASNAALSNVVAFNAQEAGVVSVSFDTRTVLGTVTEVKRVRVVNASGTGVTYDLGVDTVVDAPGIDFSLPGSATITVPAHSTIEFDVRMQANAVLMDHTREASMSASQPSTGTLVGLGVLNRHWITEETGYITFSQSGNLKLRVPLYAAPRPASDMRAGGSIGDGNPTGSGTIPLTGTSACTGTDGGATCTGTLPTDVVSLVTPFELQVISPRDPSIPAQADIQYAGVQFDQTNNRLIFGTTMWGNRTTPSDSTVNIYLDTNSDGTWDRILFAGSVGVMNTALFGNAGQDPTDTFVNASLTIATLGVALPAGINRHTNVDPGAADSALFNNNAMVMSAATTTLGVTGAFRYKVVTCPGTLPLCLQLNAFRYDEAAGPFTFDTTVANQGLNFNGGAFFFDLPGATIPVTWNLANLATQGSQGALLIHHHNAGGGGGATGEFVPMSTAVTADLSIALSSAPSSPALGGTVTLTVTATNLGAASPTGVAATVELPAGLSYVSDDGGGAFNPSTGQWTVGALASSASATLHVDATVTSTDPQVVRASIIDTTVLDSALGNNRASVDVLSPRDANLAVTVAAGSPSVVAGSPLTYTITVTNTGPDPAFDVAVSGSFTAGTGQFGAGTPSAGAYFSASGLWTLSSLPVGVTQTLTFTATALSGPTLTVTATATATTGDLATANNSASASSSVTLRQTTTAASVAASVPTGTATPVTVVVSDTEATGSTSNPAGTVAVSSSVVGDVIGGTCTLAPVGATTDQSSCQVAVTFVSSGARTITATYPASAMHATSTGTASPTATCVYGINPTSASFPSSGGTGTVTVTTTAGCPVTATSNAAFVQVTNVGTGTSAIVAYAVAANAPPSAPRSGTVTIGGQTFTVNQNGPGTIALGRSSLQFGATNQGGTLSVKTRAQAVTVRVNPADAVAWTATADQPWIRVTQGSGTGSGSFTVDVIAAPGLPQTGTVTGTITLTAALASNSPRTLAVRLDLYAPASTATPFGWIDTPLNGTTGVQGSLAMTGWALDDIEVAHVWIHRDPVSPEPAGTPIFLGEALFVPDARPDLELGAPTMPLNYRAGWGFLILTNVLPGGGTGPFTLRAFAEDADGHVTPIGARSFTASNATATSPFGTIDTPAPGETVSGTYVNFGWALTPLPNTIPVDGSTISVFIDGVFAGHPSYNHARADIAGFFPGLNNSGGPVGAFVFDSRTLTNGLHTISWTAQDTGGGVSGMGSRFFNVQNAGGSSLTAAPIEAAAVTAAVRVEDLGPDRIGVRHGADADGPVRRVPAKNGVHAIAVRPLERIELHLGEGAEPVTGYTVVGGARRDLPNGSTLQAERAVFYWQPDAAFIGRYELVFVRGEVEIRVVIVVK